MNKNILNYFPYWIEDESVEFIWILQFIINDTFYDRHEGISWLALEFDGIN